MPRLVGFETEWGSAVEKTPPPAEAVEPKPVEASLLPEYEIAGGVAARSETVARTLFNPTRRPAPPAGQDSAAARMKRGQFALTGTLLVEGRNTAFLRETAGNKARRVRAGETINGMKVAEVKADRVTLTLGDESEELVLKVATKSTPTPQPSVAAPAAPTAAVAAAPTVPARGQAPAARAAAAPTAPNQTALERRRAARAAAAAGAQQGAAGASQTPVAPPAGMAPDDAALYQSYQQRGGRRNAQK